jgi:hypothetical protein
MIFYQVFGWCYSRYLREYRYELKYYKKRISEKIKSQVHAVNVTLGRTLAGFVDHKRGRHLNFGKGIK